MFNIEREGEEHRKLSYKDKNCVGCGICVNVCPTDSLRLGPIVPIARGLIEMDFVSINQDSCVFCGLCSVACPFDSLELTIDGTSVKEINHIQYGKLNQILMMKTVFIAVDVIQSVLEIQYYLKGHYQIPLI